MPLAMVEVAGALYVGGMHAFNETLSDIRWTLLKMQTLDRSSGRLVRRGRRSRSESRRGRDFLTGLASDGQASSSSGPRPNIEWKIREAGALRLALPTKRP